MRWRLCGHCNEKCLNGETEPRVIRHSVQGSPRVISSSGFWPGRGRSCRSCRLCNSRFAVSCRCLSMRWKPCRCSPKCCDRDIVPTDSNLGHGANSNYLILLYPSSFPRFLLSGFWYHCTFLLLPYDEGHVKVRLHVNIRWSPNPFG